jgi:hypothetical protein
MTKVACLVGTVLLAGTQAQAQSTCADAGSSGRTCTYDFSVPADGYIPDWVERTPAGLTSLSVGDNAGSIEVEANGGDYYVDNNAHLTWDYVGGGFSEASADLLFAGDGDRTGWIEKYSDGEEWYGLCEPLTHATRASDEMLLVTLYDDGESFVGAFIGGDLHPLGLTLPYVTDIPPSAAFHGFAVMGVVQKLAGETAPRVLKVVQGLPIRMGADLHLSVKVWEQNGSWWVGAVGDKKDGTARYEAQAKLLGEPNLAGGVGLNGIVLPRPFYCIYYWGGVINRVFEVRRVVASGGVN